jgi:hypothetical protein
MAFVDGNLWHKTVDRLPGQLIGGGQTGDPAADHGNL